VSNYSFLEKVAHLFFSRIRPIFFFFCLSAPILMATLSLFIKYTESDQLEQRFARALKKEKIALAKKTKKEKFINRYAKADPYFIDNQIEALPFLENEKKQLEALLLHPAFPESGAIQERLTFIHNNKLSFAEEKIRTNTKVKEVEEKQKYPIQVDEQDLRKILSLLEDTPIDPFLPATAAPQIIITDLTLKKQKTPIQTFVFEVEMDLLKREFKDQ